LKIISFQILKEEPLKGRMDKSLPDILEESSLLMDNKNENNNFLDKDKLDFINKYLENQSKYSLDDFYLLENHQMI